MNQRVSGSLALHSHLKEPPESDEKRVENRSAQLQSRNNNNNNFCLHLWKLSFEQHPVVVFRARRSCCGGSSARDDACELLRICCDVFREVLLPDPTLSVLVHCLFSLSVSVHFLIASSVLVSLFLLPANSPHTLLVLPPSNPRLLLPLKLLLLLLSSQPTPPLAISFILKKHPSRLKRDRMGHRIEQKQCSLEQWPGTSREKRGGAYIWAHLFYSVFYSASELMKACFSQACVAQAVLPPGASFHPETFALPPCPPKSQYHTCRSPP